MLNQAERGRRKEERGGRVQRGRRRDAHVDRHESYITVTEPIIRLPNIGQKCLRNRKLKYCYKILSIFLRKFSLFFVKLSLILKHTTESKADFKELDCIKCVCVSW